MPSGPQHIAQLSAGDFNFSNSIITYSRMLTTEVKIGDVPMGALNPIRIQSMTTTDTMDTMGTVAQAIRMADAGCEYIRITAPSIKEAQNLAEIRKELHSRGYFNPLIADIHFTPNAAELAARIVEKVRINPGNYADRKNFKELQFSQDSYDAELDRIRKKFIPLVKICKEYGTAMRIGTNHGSLSDRIMSYYGDTPRGMVESAMEFIRICVNENYHNLVISMKSSNATVMVQAYRLLVHTMNKEGLSFPLHLGVTEAGDGEDGRIKSALGIGTLLEDGLGDTVRVSLTEEPEYEAPVAIALASRYERRAERIAAETAAGVDPEPAFLLNFPLHKTYSVSPFEYQRRPSRDLERIGGIHPPRVFMELSSPGLRDPAVLSSLGYHYSPLLDKYHIDDMAADFVYFGSSVPSFQLPGNLSPVYDLDTWKSLQGMTEMASAGMTAESPHATSGSEGTPASDGQSGLAGKSGSATPLISAARYLEETMIFSGLHFVHIYPEELTGALLSKLETDLSAVILLESTAEQVMSIFRQIYFELKNRGLEHPVVLKKSYAGLDREQFLLSATSDLGSMFLDGFGDGIWLDNMQSAFGILQASRTRISKTEYISCPSCGRTLFDLQEVTQLIRSQTSHLKGVKIAIMGCIVNGPGEMADADYGYVGAGPGKITLYRGKTVVRKNVDSDKAVAELIEIIREDGNWLELVRSYEIS